MSAPRLPAGFLASALVVGFGLAACAPVGTAPTGVGPALRGRALFGGGSAFATQATASDVAVASTVSLIDQASGVTVATTLTDASGNFSMNLGTFVPGSGAYYLEAVKGLANNAATNDSLRMRTLCQFVNGGWESMTGTTPNGPITISAGTTALSILTSLRAASTNPVTPLTMASGASTELGALDPTGATFTPGSLNVKPAEYQQVYQLVDQAFVNNQDAFDYIAYDSGSGQYVYSTLAHTVGAISPTSGPIGTAFTLTGTNFAPTYSHDVVKFKGTLATLTSGSATSLAGTIPANTITGPVTVQVGTLICLGPTFSVTPTISTFTPTSGTAGSTTVTITGTGFDPSTANDKVTFGGGATGTVTGATYTSLTVSVPSTATTGTIQVTTPGGSVTSGSSLTLTSPSPTPTPAGSPTPTPTPAPTATPTGTKVGAQPVPAF